MVTKVLNENRCPRTYNAGVCWVWSQYLGGEFKASLVYRSKKKKEKEFIYVYTSINM
jgi:hypothetical protein